MYAEEGTTYFVFAKFVAGVPAQKYRLTWEKYMILGIFHVSL